VTYEHQAALAEGAFQARQPIVDAKNHLCMGVLEAVANVFFVFVGTLFWTAV
jgi:hypothetical protein